MKSLDKDKILQAIIAARLQLDRLEDLVFGENDECSQASSIGLLNPIGECGLGCRAYSCLVKWHGANFTHDTPISEVLMIESPHRIRNLGIVTFCQIVTELRRLGCDERTLTRSKFYRTAPEEYRRRVDISLTIPQSELFGLGPLITIQQSNMTTRAAKCLTSWSDGRLKADSPLCDILGIERPQRIRNFGIFSFGDVVGELIRAGCDAETLRASKFYITAPKDFRRRADNVLADKSTDEIARSVHSII